MASHSGQPVSSCRLWSMGGWQKSKNILIKAQIACENSEFDPGDHFIQAVKMVVIGSDAKREVEDMRLSRNDCYLVVQNAD
ncbi:MAG: hypothetical protein J0M07_13370, partial [Anaerolineae bacterium]|nr:hypothetical protein [Anaerolineae bacterium]